MERERSAQGMRNAAQAREVTQAAARGKAASAKIKWGVDHSTFGKQRAPTENRKQKELRITDTALAKQRLKLGS